MRLSDSGEVIEALKAFPSIQTEPLHEPEVRRLLSIHRRRLLHASLASAALIGLPRKSLGADDKILIGYWPIASGLPLYVGLEQGHLQRGRAAGRRRQKFASAQQVAGR